MCRDICQYNQASIKEEFLAKRQSEGAVELFPWLRFIDDILVLWPGLGEGFADFLAQLDSFHPNLKYTSESSTMDITLLNLRIYKVSDFPKTECWTPVHTYKATTNFYTCITLFPNLPHPQGPNHGRCTQNATNRSSYPLTYATSLKKIG